MRFIMEGQGVRLHSMDHSVLESDHYSSADEKFISGT